MSVSLLSWYIEKTDLTISLCLSGTLHTMGVSGLMGPN